uniref:Hemoglobin beta embryonic-2 n=1 Tax=Gadus morhua TaxID=8049 RepID=A0A8C4ZMV4_GADMO
MVEWTDSERAIINSIFSNLDYEEIGRKSLCRCLIVYPWTQRYFGGFGNLYNAETILCNPLIAAHGTKILHGLDRALKNMDDIKNTYAELSLLHSDKLHVDPDNFRLLAHCMLVCMSMWPSTNSWPSWPWLLPRSTVKELSVTRINHEDSRHH